MPLDFSYYITPQQSKMFMFWILVLIGLISFYVLRIFKNRKYEGIIAKIPGPKPLPIIGNALEFGSNIAEVLSNDIRLSKEYGSFYRLWIGSRLVLVISDPDKLEKILTANIKLKKSVGYDGLRPWLGDGLVNSYDDKWRSRRKIITPAFHFNILTQFAPNINFNLNVLIKILSKTTDQPSTDVLHHLAMLTLDILSESAMRTKIGALENNNAAFVGAAKNYMEIHIARVFSFVMQNKFLFKLLPVYRRFMGYAEILHETSRKVIQDRIKERESLGRDHKGDDDIGSKSKKYFLDILLDYKDKGLLSEEGVAEEVDTFMFAGHDTTSAAVAFSLHLLAQHQDIQKNILDESNEVLGDDPEYEFNYQDIQELPYLDMFFKESLRYYPTAPFIERETTDEIEMGGVKVPVGTTLHLHIWALHHDPKYFPNPEKFDPDRFLPENTRVRHPFAYIPFSAGSRNCVGQRYAVMTSKMTILKIVRNFEITEVPDFEPIIGNHGVLTSMNGIHVKLRKRLPL